jgi:hypothetical protein
MITNSQSQYEVPKSGYITFDTSSLRQLIVNRLNEDGVYTDQNFVGSNLASIIDIISYSFHTLIYYLNRTSTESMFSESQLYENMNRVVKLLDYKPIGFQTSSLTFSCSAQNLFNGLYTIPRYSYVVTNNNNTIFSFNEDITFSKTTNFALESLDELAEQKLLFQGRYQEYPIYTAIGDDNEILTLDINNILVDHFNIDVYVKSSQTNTWSQYTKTPNLFLENGNQEKYEIRLNSNNRYEIKFGNDINGKKLQSGDIVAIYYLTSNGIQGEVGPLALDGASRPVRFETPTFNEILTTAFNSQFRYLTNPEMAGIKIINNTSSTNSQQAETVQQIRENAPTTYKSQYRLVTTKDYESFIKANFANLINDVKVINNWEYVSTYLRYFYNIGLTYPLATERALFNQIQFSDSCNFNNIYVIVLPKTGNPNATTHLAPTQKQSILTALEEVKIITTETTFIDPVYRYVSFGLNTQDNTTPSLIDSDNFDLIINKRENSSRNDISIIRDVVTIFANYFNQNNLKLGQTLSVQELTQRILNVDGVNTIQTTSSLDSNIFVEGLSLNVWNPNYPTNDYFSTQNNVPAEKYQCFLFNNLQNIQNRIKVVSANSRLQSLIY